MTIEECRKVDPSLNNLPDEELGRIIDNLYGLAELALDVWLIEKYKTPPR
mgnify:CR=1 FL=1